MGVRRAGPLRMRWAVSRTAGFVVYLDIGAHLDLMWTDPAWSQQSERFGEAWCAPFFQMRGIGQLGAGRAPTDA